MSALATRAPLALALAAAVLTGTPAGAPRLAAQTQTTRVSVTSDGSQALFGGIWSAPSADGRFIAFHSHSEDLVPGDGNFDRDLFVHDRLTGLTELVSVNDAGVQQDQGGFPYGQPALSGDGRLLAFDSRATNLTALDTHNVHQCYVRDLLAGTTRCVSVSTSGECADQDAGDPRLSVDGRVVAFTSAAGNLVAGDDDGFLTTDVFVHDRRTGVTEEVSWGLGGAPVLANAILNDLSDDGRFVTFHSFGSNLVAQDDNGATDVFLHDRSSGVTELISRSSWGRLGNATSAGSQVSSDGRYVVFSSEADNLVPGDDNGVADVFRHDRLLGKTTRISVAADGSPAHGGGASVFALSSDGRFAMLQSAATDLVPGDDNGEPDLFRKDLLSGAIERLNVSSAGQAVAPGDTSFGSHCTPDGQRICFLSLDGGLVADDTNGTFDSFVRDFGSPWSHAGCALAGLHGDPILYATGTLVPGEPLALHLVNARESSFAVLWVSLEPSSGVPVRGGCLKALPPVTQIGLFTDALGQIVLPASSPALPAGTTLGLQWLIPDAAAVGGIALSNALVATPP